MSTPSSTPHTINTYEVNFDGLVGPTHNYSGLSFGNIASTQHQAQASNPKAAALQGLAKMKALHDRGLKQGVLPPHERPHLPTLRRLGFHGNDAQVLAQAAKQAPGLLAACYSASSMWTANAATVSPSVDTADQRLHFTPANLVSKFHRAIEPETTGAILQAIFRDPQHFAHHPALPATDALGDEGAANHTRLCQHYGDPGIAFMVFGGHGLARNQPGPRHFPARQTLEASQAIARQHLLSPEKVIFAQQHPNTIDAGVFHNDVIAVGNRNLLFCHQDAFLQQDVIKKQLDQALEGQLTIIEVPRDLVSVSDAVKTYLFNSQLLTMPDGTTQLVIPEECRQHEGVWRYLNDLVAQQAGIDQLEVFDLKQSMSNGGGPACLRLRVVLNDDELAAMDGHVMLNEDRYLGLRDWINRHYRDHLTPDDLADPQLLDESRTALDELTQQLNLGSIYPFQQV